MFQLFSNIFASVVSFSGWGASQGAKQAAIYVTDKFGGSGRLSSDGRSRLKNPTLINNMSLKNRPSEDLERGGSRPSVLPNNLGSPSSQTKGALTNITAPNVRRFIKF